MCAFFVGVPMQFRGLRKKKLFSLFPAGQNKVIRMIFHLIWFVFILPSFWGRGLKKLKTMNIMGRTNDVLCIDRT